MVSFPRFSSCFAAAASRAVSVGIPVLSEGVEPFEAFREAHCIRCHGPEKGKGNLRFDQLSRDFKLGTDSQHWAEAIENVNSGEMPPKKERKPTQEEIAAFVTSLDARLKEGRAARMAARPAVAQYRLSRKEYHNTVYDLLGVHSDPAKPGEQNKDTRWHGFQRIGSELSLSPSHVDRYFRAVEQTLERPGIKRPLRHILVPRAGVYSSPLTREWLGKTGPEHSGLYRMRMQASGIRPTGGQVAHLKMGPIELDSTAPEDSPQFHEAEVFLEMPTGMGWSVVSPANEAEAKKNGCRVKDTVRAMALSGLMRKR
jgi:hypothetical protein